MIKSGTLVMKSPDVHWTLLENRELGKVEKQTLFSVVFINWNHLKGTMVHLTRNLFYWHKDNGWLSYEEFTKGSE